jgi:hypothetical protein
MLNGDNLNFDAHGIPVTHKLRHKNICSLRNDVSSDQINTCAKGRDYYDRIRRDEDNTLLDQKNASNRGLNTYNDPSSIPLTHSHGSIKVSPFDKFDFVSKKQLTPHPELRVLNSSNIDRVKGDNATPTRVLSCETIGDKLRFPENVTIVSADSGKSGLMEHLQNLTYNHVTSRWKEKLSERETQRHKLAHGKPNKWPQFNFGNTNSGYRSDFHILVLSQESYENNSLISKLMSSGYFYTAYPIEHSEIFCKAQETDLRQIAKGFVDSIKGPGKYPSAKVEFVDFYEFKLINPLLMVVGALDQHKCEEVGSLVSISKGAFTGASGIIKEIRGGKASLSMTENGNRVSRWVSREHIEVLDDPKMLQIVEDLSFKPMENTIDESVNNGISTQFSTFEIRNIVLDFTPCLDIVGNQETWTVSSLDLNRNLEDHDDNSSYISATLSENSGFKLSEFETGQSLTTIEYSSERTFQNDLFEGQTISTLSQIVYEPEKSTDPDTSHDEGKNINPDLFETKVFPDLMTFPPEGQLKLSESLFPSDDETMEKTISQKDTRHVNSDDENKESNTQVEGTHNVTEETQKSENDYMDYYSTNNVQHWELEEREQTKFCNHDTLQQSDLGETENLQRKSSSDNKDESLQERFVHSEECQEFESSDNAVDEDISTKLPRRKWHVKDTSSALRFIKSMSLLEIKEKLKFLKQSVQGGREQVLERLVKTLKINNESTFESLPEAIRGFSM